MKALITWRSFLVLVCLGSFLRATALASFPSSVATITLNNLDADKPIFYLSTGTLLPQTGSYVQLLGGASPDHLAPVAAVTEDKSSVFPLAMDGYFFAGIGSVPGVTPGATAYFQLRAWKGSASFETAKERGTSAIFSQETGRWDPAGQPPSPPSGPVLRAPSIIVRNAPVIPTIVQQPQSQIVSANTTVTFSVGLSDANEATYQWSKDGAVLPGEVLATLRLNPVQLSHAGVYTVTVLNSAGSTTSQAAVLIVNPPPVPLTGSLATISLNNLDSDQPIFYLDSSNLLPVAGSYVQLLGGASPDSLTPVFSLAPDQSRAFPLAMDGFFYAGIGNVPGVTPGGLAHFQLRVWRDAPSFETALERGASSIFSQITGRWNSNDLPPSPPSGPVLNVPSVKVSRFMGYSLALASNPAAGGSISTSAAPLADGTFPPGTALTLTARPAAGYLFSRWSGHVPAGQETLNPLPGLRIDQNKSLTAHFLPALQITSQPLSQTVEVGAQVRFTVVASGAGALRYQWRLNGSPLVDNPQIQGAASPNLVLNNVQVTQAGNYDVVLYLGQEALVSAPAILTVQVPATLTLIKSDTRQALLQLEGTPGQTYVVENSSDLRNWTPFGTNTTSAAGIAQWLVPFSTTPADGQQFYRAQTWSDAFVPDPKNWATVSLNNYDVNRPIYYLGQLAAGEVRVELLGGPVGGPLRPVVTADQDRADLFALSEPGYFFGGTGIIEGVRGGETAQFQLRAWYFTDHYETATRRGSTPLFQQPTGRWDSTLTPPQVPIGVPLQIPSILVIE